jgi:rubrerythrin
LIEIERDRTMPTRENLQTAFAGESQANRTYLAFAAKAEAEGRPQIARLFRAAAAAETVHAHSHLRVMGGIKGTAENLQVAAEGEAYEFQEMYPEFLKAAEAEKNQAAVIVFRHAMAVEMIHHDLYAEALETSKAGRDLPDSEIYVCEVCGNTVKGEAPDKCPICGARKERFSKVE